MRPQSILAGALCLFLGVAATASAPSGSYAGKDDDAKLIAALGTTKHTLEAGIRQAASASEAAISAKFELEDKGELSLSVYVAGKGLSVDAEHNALKELSGDPTKDKWVPETEVFKDVEHISRSAEQLTIMSLSKMSLTDVIAKASKDHAGTVYSVTPKMRDRKAVFVVLVADKGKSHELTYDAMTGAKK